MRPRLKLQFFWEESGCGPNRESLRRYTELLREHKIQISMSCRGNPYDNAQAESFMEILKYEEVYRSDRDERDARGSIGRFLDKVYNQERLHSALRYVPPAEFERKLLKTKLAEASA